MVLCVVIFVWDGAWDFLGDGKVFFSVAWGDECAVVAEEDVGVFVPIS